MPLTQQPRFDSQRSQKNFRGKIADIAEVNQRCYLEESGQWLENADQTHLVLAVGGKPVLQKSRQGQGASRNVPQARQSLKPTMT